MSITRTAIPEHLRVTESAKHFGLHCPLQVEPTIYQTADGLSSDYHGGYWGFWTLSNGGFYMAPTYPATLMLSCPNDFAGTLSADAFGIVVCLYAYSQLGFEADAPLVDAVTEHYHRLRRFAFEHPAVEGILRAID